VPAAGAVRDTVGGVVSLLTVTVTAADVVELPAASRATAASVWVPLVPVVVVHETAQRAAGPSPPWFAPSIVAFSPTPPTLSVAVAVPFPTLVRSVPAAGAVRDTVGAVVSLPTVTVTAADVVELPAVSRATAVSVWVPLVP